ncbi:hypothetical protein AVEN_197948-1, partial [Araneus ventricosus]
MRKTDEDWSDVERKGGYCPTTTRKTLQRVTASRRVEGKRETGIKSSATF